MILAADQAGGGPAPGSSSPAADSTDDKSLRQDPARQGVHGRVVDSFSVSDPARQSPVWPYFAAHPLLGRCVAYSHEAHLRCSLAPDVSVQGALHRRLHALIALC